MVVAMNRTKIRDKTKNQSLHGGDSTKNKTKAVVVSDRQVLWFLLAAGFSGTAGTGCACRACERERCQLVRHWNSTLTASGGSCCDKSTVDSEYELAGFGTHNNECIGRIGIDTGQSEGSHVSKYHSNSLRQLRGDSACLSHTIDAGACTRSSECAHCHFHDGSRCSRCIGEIDIIGRLGQDLNTRQKISRAKWGANVP